MSRLRAAPWPVSLQLMSLVGTILVGGVSYAAYRAIPHGTRAPFAETFGTWVACVPPLILVGAALFVVLGYEVAPEGLFIRRLLWRTYFDWYGLREAYADGCAMKGSLRIWGNGGLYAVTGLYRNRALGGYRAFVTDPRRTVVLRFADRVVVVSPEDPQEFLRQVAMARPGVRIGAGGADAGGVRG